jgi:hypothetical protein
MRTLVLFGRLRRKEPGAGGVAGYGRGYFARPSQACEARTNDGAGAAPPAAGPVGRFRHLFRVYYLI